MLLRRPENIVKFLSSDMTFFFLLLLRRLRVNMLVKFLSSKMTLASIYLFFLLVLLRRLEMNVSKLSQQ